MSAVDRSFTCGFPGLEIEQLRWGLKSSCLVCFLELVQGLVFLVLLMFCLGAEFDAGELIANLHSIITALSGAQ